MKKNMLAFVANIAVLAPYVGFLYAEWLFHQNIPLPLHLLLLAAMMLFTYFVAAPLWLNSFPRKRRFVIYLMISIILILGFVWDLLRTVHSGNVFSLEIFMVPIVLALLFFSVKEAIFVLFLCVMISTVHVLMNFDKTQPGSILSGLLQVGICIVIIFIMDRALKVRASLMNKQHILVENSSAFILGIDRNGKIDLCNPAMCRLLNMKRNEVLDQFFWKVGVRLVNKDADQIFQLLAQRQKVDQMELNISDSYKNTYTYLADTYLVNDDGLASGLIVVLNDITERIVIERKLYELSVTDELTKIANRRHFEKRFDEEVIRSNRYGHPLSLILIDLDHFKQINDTYGHIFGDQVLQTAAKVLKMHVRDTDLVSRWGGEEFAILLPETTLSEAEEIGARLLAKVQETPIPLQDDQSVTVTFSAGVTTRTHDIAKENVIASADSALYQAKQNGRNRVMIDQ
ncbi:MULTISPECIES: diguanylate cyclase [unclassified Paenibacillus]|uniref:sensor domain-containing diguanylate cyclase n=1 Tax=unclassified Paenibacillus TaxID=185978 RepID=UPI001AE8FAEC|nr:MULTISPECIES: diguanylate cyclase [unclassified Paenibacillus]MBP1154041.1 diguanylate cyclase (GGDEF)-like protein/PAS domain S-box-containing protein [Paenibacillus sp. PvP091]MBP1170574.1 diguanylate cyclase (GGDEF)-like protein/PAS domain S-box-containing protein [Paenibacillus sp. PvR098]MBP2441602.1 diguanylate cyclase (GGDEF)-like protein/PAS domain S-box-containing protein [Paenibacillus sp. PvP052]